LLQHPRWRSLVPASANLPSHAGPPAATLKAATARLEELGVKILARSSLYETPSWPDPGQPIFVNAVAVVETTLQPVELLALLHGVETAFGRMRSAPNAARTLDIDLLDYDGRITTEGLTLPHPRMTGRAFVLRPLADLAPAWRHPITGRPICELLTALPADQGAERLTP